MAKITKKAKLIAAKVNAEQKYEVAEAVKLVKEFATAFPFHVLNGNTNGRLTTFFRKNENNEK